MTTTAKRKQPAKKKKPLSPINEIILDGKEYVLVPAEEFKEMLSDQMLGIISTERLADDDTFIPAEVVNAKCEAQRRGRKNA